MALKHDFQVLWQGDQKKTSIAILRHIIERPTKGNLPQMVLVTGKSGSGKSNTVIEIMDGIYSDSGIDFAKFLLNSIVIEPMEFSEKVDALLNNINEKKLWMLQIDEARFVVGADNWNSFYNHAVGHIRAASRAIKPIALFVLTQFSMDIDKKTRSAPDYIFECSRSANRGTIVRPYVVYVDERDPNNPVIRKRKLYGIIKHEGKIIARGWPQFQVSLVRKELLDIYDAEQIPKKLKLLQNIIKRLLDKMRLDFGGDGARKQLDEILKHFVENKEELKNWAVFKRNKWKLKSDVALKMNLSGSDVSWLEDKLTCFDRDSVLVKNSSEPVVVVENG